MADKIKEESGLELLKQGYEKYKKKYNLPDFYELSKLFDIEETDFETDFLLRKIRRVISDKISGYLRFVETILNPSSAPIFFFKLIKKLDNKDKEILTSVYEKLGNFEISIIQMDLDYNEEKEAEFIKEVFSVFNKEIRLYLLDVAKKLGNGENITRENNSSYCG